MQRQESKVSGVIVVALDRQSMTIAVARRRRVHPFCFPRSIVKKPSSRHEHWPNRVACRLACPGGRPFGNQTNRSSARMRSGSQTSLPLRQAQWRATHWTRFSPDFDAESFDCEEIRVSGHDFTIPNGQGDRSHHHINDLHWPSLPTQFGE